jgi:hypothetical protein
MGERRLKNVFLVLEWAPEDGKDQLRRRVLSLHQQLTVGCGNKDCTNERCASNPNVTAMENKQGLVAALQLVKTSGTITICATVSGADLTRYVVSLSLAEAETVRKVLHQNASWVGKTGMALRDLEVRHP